MKKFWKSYIDYYRNDKFGLWFVIIFGIICGLGVVSFTSSTSFPLFIVGYVLTDPINYYFRIYFKQQRIKKAAGGKPCKHEPLLEREDGTLIQGTKRCKHCGLNESYWERFSS